MQATYRLACPAPHKPPIVWPLSCLYPGEYCETSLCKTVLQVLEQFAPRCVSTSTSAAFTCCHMLPCVLPCLFRSGQSPDLPINHQLHAFPQLSAWHTTCSITIQQKKKRTRKETLSNVSGTSHPNACILAQLPSSLAHTHLCTHRVCRDKINQSTSHDGSEHTKTPGPRTCELTSAFISIMSCCPVRSICNQVSHTDVHHCPEKRVRLHAVIPAAVLHHLIRFGTFITKCESHQLVSARNDQPRVLKKCLLPGFSVPMAILSKKRKAVI